MECLVCGGKKVVWQGDSAIGILKCKPCPACNDKSLMKQRVMIKGGMRFEGTNSIK